MNVRLEYRNRDDRGIITLYTFLKDIIKIGGVTCAHININNKEYDKKYETHIPIGRQLSRYYK